MIYTLIVLTSISFLYRIFFLCCLLYFILLSPVHFCTNFTMQLSIYYYQRQLVVLKALMSLLVGSNGLGPSTSRLSGVCSNQLSYEPIMVEVSGFEPLTPCLQGRCSTS